MISNRAVAIIAAILLLFAGAAGAFAVWHGAQKQALVEDLQRGGYVIYLRHAQRLKGERETLGPDSPLSDFEDCSVQRNLTPYGEGQAVLLGNTLRNWNVSFDQVIANPLCRTRQTAMLAFGRATLDQRMYDPQFVRKMLAVRPSPGLNNVLVGSESQLREIIGDQIEPAEMAIFEPDGAGGFTLVGRIPPEQWLAKER
jgi:phosphohistidine phosphatase SixA